MSEYLEYETYMSVLLTACRVSDGIACLSQRNSEELHHGERMRKTSMLHTLENPWDWDKSMGLAYYQH